MIGEPGSIGEKQEMDDDGPDIPGLSRNHETEAQNQWIQRTSNPERENKSLEGANKRNAQAKAASVLPHALGRLIDLVVKSSGSEIAVHIP